MSMLSSIKGKLSLKKVTIQPYTSDDYSSTAGEAFVADLNPEEYSFTRSNSITTAASPGASAGKALYAHGENDKLSMSLLFDGTGATGLVDSSGVGSRLGPVTDKVQAFRKLLTYNGEIHAPPLLKVTWDDEIFSGFMTQASEKYTMFDRSGEPIRAKVDASFVSAVAPGTQAAYDRTSSPDVARVWKLQERDRLDLVAHKSYGHAEYWYSLARANRLANPRALAPGRSLLMPRLERRDG